MRHLLAVFNALYNLLPCLLARAGTTENKRDGETAKRLYQCVRLSHEPQAAETTR